MRVLVTRPEAEATITAAALARLGHECVLAPVLRIQPVEFVAPAQRFAAVLITSANAVRPGLPDGPGAPLYVVGARTAAALQRLGHAPPHDVADDSKGLVAALLRDLPASAAVLYCAGRDRKSDIEAVLRDNGHHVTVLVVYEAEAATTLPESVRIALAAGQIAAVLHYSRRSAGIFVALAEAAGLARALDELRHLCLSEDVAVPLRQRQGPFIRIAAQPDEAHLLALLDE